MLSTIWNYIRLWFRPLTLGERGERAAAKFLRKKRYIIVARSTRYKTGELDIVAVDDRTVVFVEVKTRRSDSRGDPAEAVTAEKQKRLTRAALRFLKLHDLMEHQSRFDVIAITWPEDAKQPTIEHYINAFESVGDDRMF